MTSRISYDNALHIVQKGKYYPQPTNHAGLPVNPVFCDYCGRGGLGGSWKIQDTPQWDICMQCYVNLQLLCNIPSNNTTSNNTTSIENNKFFPMSGNLNQDFHNQFNNNSIIQPSWEEQEQQLWNQDNYQSQSSWSSDVPGSYSNRIITSKDGWIPL